MTKSEKVEKIEFSQTYMIMVQKCSLQSEVYFWIKIFSICMEKNFEKWIFLKTGIFEFNRVHIEKIQFFHQKVKCFSSKLSIQGFFDARNRLQTLFRSKKFSLMSKTQVLFIEIAFFLLFFISAPITPDQHQQETTSRLRAFDAGDRNLSNGGGAYMGLIYF